MQCARHNLLDPPVALACTDVPVYFFISFLYCSFRGYEQPADCCGGAMFWHIWPGNEAYCPCSEINCITVQQTIRLHVLATVAIIPVLISATPICGIGFNFK